MQTSIKAMCDEAYLAHPGDPDGKSIEVATLEIADDASDEGDWQVRIEVRCRAPGENREEHNYGWHECSVRLDLDDAKELHSMLGVMIQNAEK